MSGYKFILVCLLFIAIGFSIAKLTTKPEEKELVLPNISRETDLIDSLKRVLKQDSAMIKGLYYSIDSLKFKIEIGHKNLNNGIKSIKKFSHLKTNTYLDSIYSADSK